MGYHLFLDDARQPKDVKWIDLPLYHWFVVKNFKEFVGIIKLKGIPETVSFDHDFYQEHYDEYTVSHDPLSPSYGRIRYEIFTQKTGMECAKWLAEECIAKKVPIPEYFIHTLNPIGKENIRSILESARTVLAKA